MSLSPPQPCLRSFQKREHARLDKMRAGKKGWGLQTLQDLKRGQFIIEYVGEVLEESKYALRKQKYTELGQRHYYFMTLSGSEARS